MQRFQTAKNKARRMSEVIFVGRETNILGSCGQRLKSNLCI